MANNVSFVQKGKSLVITIPDTDAILKKSISGKVMLVASGQYKLTNGKGRTVTVGVNAHTPPTSAESNLAPGESPRAEAQAAG